MLAYLKLIIIFALLAIHFVFSDRFIYATGFNESYSLRDGLLTVNEGGIIFNVMQLDIFREIKLAKARERYKAGGRLKRLKQEKVHSEKRKEERRLRESKLNPLLVSKGYKPRKGIIIKCLVCGKEKYIRSSHFKKSTKYCSKKCYNVVQYENSRKECIICGKIFVCYPSAIRLRNRKTCSMDCRGKLATQRAEGKIKNQPEAKKRRSLRYSKKFTDWRKAVFERDDYTCQDCKARSKKGNPVYLEPHHIKQYAFFPKLRFDINNGKTLCKKCHKKIRYYHTFEKELLAKELQKEVDNYKK